MAETVKIEGMNDLMRKFDLLDEIGKSQTLWRAATAGMLVIINAAKRIVPYKTGTLRRSLHVGGATNLTSEFKAGEGYSDLGVGKREGNSVEVYGGTDVIYARIREFGGTIKAKKAGWLRWKGEDGAWHRARQVTQSGKPYLRPAFDENWRKAVDEIGKALRALILAVANK